MIEVFNADYDNGLGGKLFGFQIYNSSYGSHQVVSMLKEDLDKSETDKFKVVQL